VHYRTHPAERLSGETITSWMTVLKRPRTTLAGLLSAWRSGVFVVVPAVLLEVLGHEIHRGGKSDSANDCAHDSDVMAIGDHTADNQGDKERECRRDTASSILWSHRIFLLVAHVDLLPVSVQSQERSARN